MNSAITATCLLLRFNDHSGEGTSSNRAQASVKTATGDLNEQEYKSNFSSALDRHIDGGLRNCGSRLAAY
jgi:hypothetical protein